MATGYERPLLLTTREGIRLLGGAAGIWDRCVAAGWITPAIRGGRVNYYRYGDVAALADTAMPRAPAAPCLAAAVARSITDKEGTDESIDQAVHTRDEGAHHRPGSRILRKISFANTLGRYQRFGRARRRANGRLTQRYDCLADVKEWPSIGC